MAFLKFAKFKSARFDAVFHLPEGKNAGLRPDTWNLRLTGSNLKFSPGQWKCRLQPSDDGGRVIQPGIGSGVAETGQSYWMFGLNSGQFIG